MSVMSELDAESQGTIHISTERYARAHADMTRDKTYYRLENGIGAPMFYVDRDEMWRYIRVLIVNQLSFKVTTYVKHHIRGYEAR